MLQAFADTRTLLYLPEGPIDFASKTGRLMGTMRAAIAGMEREEIKERVWSAKEEKRRRGELAQSEICLPWGVGYKTGRGFFYKPEAERVREAYRRFLAGEQSYVSLSQLVGVTPRGMHLVLRNPIWMGWRIIDKKRDHQFCGTLYEREWPTSRPPQDCASGRRSHPSTSHPRAADEPG